MLYLLILLGLNLIKQYHHAAWTETRKGLRYLTHQHLGQYSDPQESLKMMVTKELFRLLLTVLLKSMLVDREMCNLEEKVMDVVQLAPKLLLHQLKMVRDMGHVHQLLLRDGLLHQ